jgi:hypothetical protein
LTLRLRSGESPCRCELRCSMSLARRRAPRLLRRSPPLAAQIRNALISYDSKQVQTTSYARRWREGLATRAPCQVLDHRTDHPHEDVNVATIAPDPATSGRQTSCAGSNHRDALARAHLMAAS